MYEPTSLSSGPPSSLSGVTALPPTLLDSLSSLLTGQKGQPWMDGLPPHYLCGHRLGLPGQDGRWRGLPGVEKVNVLLSALVKVTERHQNKSTCRERS